MRFLEGWKEVERHLRDEYGLTLSRTSLWRATKRPDDPIPFRPVLANPAAPMRAKGRKRIVVRVRVVVESDSLAAWVRRNYADVP